jgi:TonB family protein
MTQYRGSLKQSRWPRSRNSASTGLTPGRHVASRAPAGVAALAAYLLAASTASALGVDDSAAPSAPSSKPAITPVRVAQGLNLGDACEHYYPLSSRMAREFGATTLIVYVDVDGRVRDTRIEIGSGYVALDEAAEHCIMERGRFVPQTIDSSPVGSWQRMKFTWRLDSPARSDAADSLLSAYRKGDYPRLAKLLVPYARDGAIDAQIMLARMYLHGTGVTADAAEAATWMRKAAEQGSTVAEYQSGVLSEDGIGVARDYAVAASWFRKAAHQRHADAAFNLALMYQSGLGVERDPTMALLWIEAAIGFLVPPSAEAVRPGYVSTRDSIRAGMSPDQIDVASRSKSPDGPVIRGYLRNRAAIEKAARAAYPAHLGEHNGVRTVALLVFVLADGHVGDTRVETSSGLPKLDAVTVQVLSQGEIIPRNIGGRSVDAWQIVTWTWALH